MQIGGERPRVQISGKRKISPNPCNRLEETRSQFNLSIINLGGEKGRGNGTVKITTTRSETRMVESVNEGDF